MGSWGMDLWDYDTVLPVTIIISSFLEIIAEIVNRDKKVNYANFTYEKASQLFTSVVY